MKRIECVLLMISIMSLGVAAQTPKNVSGGEDASQSRENAKPEAAKPGVAKSEAVPQSDADAAQPVADAAQPQIAEASTVSTSASASFSPLPPDALVANVPAANVQLQSEIQEALSKDPALSKCGVVVSASAEGIDLTGSAGNSRERLAAWRLAESYARGKKVENHILVNGQGGPAPANTHPENGTPASNPAPSAASSPGLQNNRQ